MKICIIASTYPRCESDPAVPWLRENLNRLRARGLDVHVFAPAHKGLRSHTIDGVPVHRFRYFFAAWETLTHDEGAPTKIRRPDYLLLTLFYILFGTLGLMRHQRVNRFEILHVHWPFPHAFMGIAAACAAPARLVMSFHGAELLLGNRFTFVEPLLRFFTARAAALTCNSSYTAQAVHKLGTHEPLILPYGSPVESKPTPRDNSQTLALPPPPAGRVLFVGRLIERKGVEYLIDAMPLVLERMPDAKLTIVGRGTLLDALKERAAKRGLRGAVEFRHSFSESELAAAYAECDVFVLPAIVDSKGDTEGLGVVLIEALTLGKPVVASSVGGIVDIVAHRQTGLLVPQKETVALAGAIVELLENPALARQLADQGQKHVASFFDWETIIDRTEVLYHLVLTNEGRKERASERSASRSLCARRDKGK